MLSNSVVCTPALCVQSAVEGSYLLCVGIPFTAAFNVSLELLGGDCSDQLTLICRHSDDGSAPLWIHNGTVESGAVLATAFPGAVYTVLARTEHTATITGIDNVRALDGHVIQCLYEELGNLTKSNAVKYSFFPPGQSYHNTWLGLSHVMPLSANGTCCRYFQLAMMMVLSQNRHYYKFKGLRTSDHMQAVTVHSVN